MSIKVYFKNGSSFIFSPTEENYNIKMCEEIVAITIVGSELDYVKENYTNLPWNTLHKAQTWFGDHARFIVSNWIFTL